MSYLTRGWANLGIDTYQMISIASEDKKAVAQKSVTSFRPISDKELASVTKHEIKVVNATKGQTIEDLIRGTASKDSAELVAVMNDVEKDQPLRSMSR